MLILFLEYFKDRERQISSALFYINLQLFLSLRWGPGKAARPSLFNLIRNFGKNSGKSTRQN